jgi:hypothetical protein
MFALSGSGIHGYYAANLYCSLQALHYTSVLWIATDELSSSYLQQRDCVSIRWGHDPPKDFFSMTMLRWFIMEELLSSGYEVFYCDTDSVFLGNPDDLLFGDVDIEFTAEAIVATITKDYPANQVNTGHIRAFPTQSSLSFIKDFISYAFTNRHQYPEIFQHDQTLLIAYLGTMTWSYSNPHFLFSNGLKLGFFDPLKSSTGGQLQVSGNRKMMTQEAEKRGVTRPIVYHLAFWPQGRKPSALSERNLWFVDFPRSMRCLDPPPNGTSFFWNNSCNVPSLFSHRFVWRDRYLPEVGVA